jgi:hypothetical protein
MLCEDVGATCIDITFAFETQKKPRRKTEIQMNDRYDTDAVLGETLLRL